MQTQCITQVHPTTAARYKYVRRWVRRRIYYSREYAITAVDIAYRDGMVTSTSLATATGVSRQYAARVLRLLVGYGILARSQRTGRGTHYTITPSDPPHYRAERKRKHNTTYDYDNSLKGNTKHSLVSSFSPSNGGEEKKVERERYVGRQRRCKRVWDEIVQLRRGDCRIWRRGPWMRDLILLARNNVRDLGRDAQQMVASIVYRTTVVYRLTVSRALHLVHTITTWARRLRRRITMKRLTWCVRRWLVGKKRAKQSGAHLRCHGTVSRALSVMSQRDENRYHTPPAPIPSERDLTPEALLRPDEAADYRRIEAMMQDLGGYDRLPRREKKRWNEVNSIYVRLRVAAESQSGLARAERMHKMQTDPHAQLMAAMSQQLVAELADQLEALARKICRIPV